MLADVSVVCAGAALAAGVPQGAAPQHSFDLQGHRGARGLAPENTLVAFARALSLGVTTLELDTVVTRDGVVVVSHDAALNPDLTRGPDGRWLEAPGPLILTLTRAELLRYDVGRTRPDCPPCASPSRSAWTGRACRPWPRCTR